MSNLLQDWGGGRQLVAAASVSAAAAAIACYAVSSSKGGVRWRKVGKVRRDSSTLIFVAKYRSYTDLLYTYLLYCTHMYCTSRMFLHVFRW